MNVTLKFFRKSTEMYLGKVRNSSPICQANTKPVPSLWARAIVGWAARSLVARA